LQNLHFQQSLYNTLTLDVIMTSCRTETETVSRMKKAWPFDCCCSHQSVASPFLQLLMSELTADILSTFCDWMVVPCVKLMLSKFLHLCFLLFDCFVYCQNVTCLKRFTTVWALHRWGGRHNHSQTRDFFLNHCVKNYST